MLTVSHDPAAVEFQLFSRTLTCPRCHGSLKPWGFGRERIIRVQVPAVNRRVLPRRARCHECEATHVLLPAVFAARRADAAAVIAHAVESSIAGRAGHRKIAAQLGRPPTTVRGWIRDFRANAPLILAEFAARVHRATAEALGFWPAPLPTAAANALGMLMAHARVLAHHHAAVPGQDPVANVPWHVAALAGHGPWFFSAVGWPEKVQHQPALPLGG